MLEHPIYMWGCNNLYMDNVTNLVTGLIWTSYVTNRTKVITQMPTCKRLSVLNIESSCILVCEMTGYETLRSHNLFVF